MQTFFIIRRAIGVGALCGCVLLTVCNNSEQSSGQSGHGVATRVDQSSLAETTIILLLLAAKQAHMKSVRSAAEAKLNEAKKDVAENLPRSATGLRHAPDAPAEARQPRAEVRKAQP
jgi:hypothetical protein